MKRLIDANALKEWFPDNGEGSWTYNVTVKACIDAQPTVHAVPAVRCWACKYYHTETCPMLREQDGDGYCSFGKPRVD